MADGIELRVHPGGQAVLALSVQSQGQGHETTFAQVVAEELGILPADIDVVHGDTDHTPYGLGTYGSRSIAVSGAAAAQGAQGARQGPADRRRHAGGRARRPGLGEGHLPGARHPRRRGHHAGDRASAYGATCPTTWRAGWRRSWPTTRRTSPSPSAPTCAWSTSTPAPPR
ncbi:MAG: molybdopterin cofactor-binding domain-containing protein [Nocardioides sp.]